MTNIDRPPPTPIEFDYSCIHCGYNLRGLQQDGLCPECGQTIQIVEEAELLRFADPDWLERLRFGTAIKLWSIALSLLLGMLAGFFVGFGFPVILVWLAAMISGALGLWGTLCITAQEPRVSLQENPVTLRAVLRALATAGFIGSVWAGATSGWTTGTVAFSWISAIGTLLSYGSTAAAYGELFYFRRFARRLPDEKLTRSTTRIIWASGIVGGLGIVFGIVVTAFVWSGGMATLAGPPPAGSPGGTAGPSGVVTVTTGTSGIAANAGGRTTPSSGASTTAITGAPPPTPALGLAIGLTACFGGIVALAIFLWYARLLGKYRESFKVALALSRTHHEIGETPVEPAPDSGKRPY